MSRERRTEVTVLVPGKAKRGAGARIRYVFENRTEENAVSRVLARRTDTTRAGRSIGMREALLERICDALAIVGRKEVTGASAHRDAAEVAR